MKTHWGQFTSILVLVLLSFGCSKKDEVQPPISTSPSFEEQLLTVLPLMEENQMVVVQMTATSSGHGSPVFTIRPLSESVGDSRAIVCQGSGVGFAR